MAVDRDALVVGLTSSFGSGSSTLAKALGSPELDFEVFSLSDIIKEEWRTRPAGAEQPKRGDLQDLGNELRREHGNDYVAARSLELAGSKAQSKRLAFDSIRNRDEVEFFRDAYRNFFLVAVQCSRAERWKRMRPTYAQQKLGEDAFDTDDVRDQIEEMEWGQQVQLCVDDADVVINNEERRQSGAGAVQALRQRAQPYVGLMTAESPRPSTEDEILMTVAYTEAEKSACLKRHVGAVIADRSGRILSAGFNDNPEPMKPCYKHFTYCHKESIMLGEIERLEGTPCPDCREQLPKLSRPYRCPNCNFSLKQLRFPDRGLRFCTALHAEIRAIRGAGGRDLTDCVLYTTTFPCYGCAKEVVHAGIKEIVYVEPYPDPESLWYLNETGLEVRPFEGVKARAFHRLFSPIRAEMERKYDIGGE